MIKRFIFAFVTSMLVSSVFSQGIEGKVVDCEGKAIENASVALLSKKDSSFIVGTVTDNSGIFHISKDINEGILAISFIGYKMEYKAFTDGNVGVVKLEEERQMLGNVTVTGTRIVNNANGYSLRPRGSGLETVNTAQEMFAFLPAITINENKIQLFDKNPTIYVNGIKITSQDELASLNPKRIEKIEVDYFSVGERVDDKGGVIRITTKKDANGGYSGYLRESVDEMASYGHIEDSPTIVLSASMGKWTFNYYTEYSHRKLLEDATYNYAYNSGEIKNMDNKSRSWENYVGGRLNVSYELSKRSTIAISEFISNNDVKNNMFSSVETIDKDKKQGIRLYGPQSTFKQQTVGKYILNTDGHGSNFEISADYLFQNYHWRQSMEIDNGSYLDNKTKEHTNMFRIAPRYTKMYANGNKMKLGVNYQFIDYDDQTDNLQNSVKIHVPSVFINYSGRVKKIMYAVGLTLQHNSLAVNTEQQRTSFDDTYLCPQANLMWTINPEHGTMFTLMYQRGVGNMPYSVVNGYKNYSTPTHYTTGNPSLHTPSDHQLMARFTINRHIAMTMMYYREDDAIYYDHGLDEDDITWSKPFNADYEQAVGLRTEITQSLTKWWNTKLQVGVQQLRFASSKETLNGKLCGKFWWNNIFKFSSTFGGTLNAYWETGTSFEHYSWRPVGHVKASLWKSFLNERLRLSLSSNVFSKGRKSLTFDDSYTSRYHNATKTTSFTFDITWNFSGGKKVRQRIEAESLQDYNKIEERK